MRRMVGKGSNRLWFGAAAFVLLTVIIWLVVVNSQELPATRPQSFRVTYHAFIPEAELYEEMVIAPLGSYYQYTYKTYTGRINFTLNEAELDAVYDVFTSTRFNRMPSGDDSLSRDETGTAVTLEAGRWEHTVIEAPESAIDEAWAGSWQFVRQAISAVRGREFQDQVVIVTFRFDGSLLGVPLNLYLNREVLFEGEIDADTLAIPIEVHKIPGNYLLEAVAGDLYSYELTLPEVTDVVIAFQENGLTVNGQAMQRQAAAGE
jgi:hypothetical protein